MAGQVNNPSGAVECGVVFCGSLGAVPPLDRRLVIGKLAIGDNPSPIPGARPKASLIPARATPWEKATDFHRRPTACLIPESQSCCAGTNSSSMDITCGIDQRGRGTRLARGRGPMNRAVGARLCLFSQPIPGAFARALPRLV